MSAHTKGPWHVDPKRKFRVFAESDTTIGSFGSSSEIRDQWQANAALCAAAPFLLEALRAMVDLISYEKGWGTDRRMDDSQFYSEAADARNLARTAIAKATPAPSTQEVSK